MPTRKIKVINNTFQPDIWNAYGVGSTGIVLGNDVVQINVRSESRSVPVPPEFIVNPGFADQRRQVVYQWIQWRVRVYVLTLDTDSTKIYNQDAQRMQLGELVYTVGDDIVSHHEYVSFQKQISGVFQYVEGYNYALEDWDDVDCDEPPLNLALDPPIAEWAYYTGVEEGFNVPAKVGETGYGLADKVTFYPQLSVQSYIVAVTWNLVRSSRTTTVEGQLRFSTVVKL